MRSIVKYFSVFKTKNNFDRVKWIILTTTFIVIILRYYRYYLYPFVSTDGPWELSSLFSFLRGEQNVATFAHEFVGPLFTHHIKDAFLSIWYANVGVSTLSFIQFGFILLILTVVFWVMSFRDSKSLLPFLLIFSYACSPYTYGFRTELYISFLLSVFIYIYSIVYSKEVYVSLLLGILTTILGYFHPLAAVVSFFIYGIIFFLNRYSWRVILFYGVSGIVTLLLIGLTNFKNLVKTFTSLDSDTGNHFSGFHFDLLIKYFLQGGPIVVFIFFIMIYKLYNGKDKVVALILSLFLLFLLVAGRSYYFPYLISVLLVILITLNKKNDIIINQKLGFVFKCIISYSILFYVFVPFILSVLNKDTNQHFIAILKTMKQEQIRWDEGSKYYIPSQLSLEVVNNKGTRLLYPAYYVNNGKSDISDGDVIYIFSSSQKEWIGKNFRNSSELKMEELISAKSEGISISTLYKFKPSYSDSVGLWKYEIP